MLRIAEDIELPLSAVTRTHGLIAVRGAGKSNVAVRMAEQMHKHGLPWVAIDVKGDWWGIQSSGNGKGPGLDVPILGGLHGDIPLEPASGSFVAELVVEHHLTCVLDLSEMTKGEQARFLVDFAERLFRLKNKDRFPLHLYLTEADDYIPQRVMRDQARVVGAFARIVKQGRNRGLGMTMDTQRCAVLNNDVLTQLDTLIALRTTAPPDRKAILGWVETHAVGKDIVDSLPALEDGEGWIWSPQAYKIMRRTKFLRRETFDSGATPEVGDELLLPKRRADIDLAAIKESMAATIEKAKADDPKELRRQITELRRELAQRDAAPAAEVVEKVVERVVEKRVLPNGAKAAHQVIVDYAAKLTDALTGFNGLLDRFEEVSTDRPGGRQDPMPAPARTPALPRRPRSDPPPAGQSPAVNPLNLNEPGGGDRSLSGAPRKILAAIALYPDGCSKARAAMISGVGQKKSTLRNALSTLRTAGYIEQGSVLLVATAAGVAALGDHEPLPTGPELLAHWRSGLNPSETGCFDHLVAVYPARATRDELAAATGIDPAKSTLRNALSRLNVLGLVEGNSRDGWAADPDLMESIA